MAIAASNSWLVNLDNVSHLGDWISDALCRISTGGGFATRELYSDTDETIFAVQRPCIVNGIEECVTRGDLLDRAVMIESPALAEQDRLPEKEFWSSFEKHRPAILAYLMDAVVGAIANLPNTKIKHPPRMADYALWCEAAGPSFGWPPGHFLEIYRTNREEGAELALDGSAIGRIVQELPLPWNGTAAQLLYGVNARATDSERKLTGYPKSARGVSGSLRRLVPAFRSVGLTITFERAPGGAKGARTRMITITGSPNQGRSGTVENPPEAEEPA